MNPRTYSGSFGGGEVTPEFWGQINDSKFQTGLALCRNFRILPHGPAQNRAGTAYVATVKTSAKRTRLLPFTYSTVQTMVLEFGEFYIRFHTMGAPLMNGAVPYEIATPYAEADLFTIDFVQSGDVLTLVHQNYAPAEVRRLGALNWTYTAIVFATALAPPTTLTAVATLGATPGTPSTHRYAVTTVGPNGLDESLISLPAAGPSISITAVTNANPGVLTTSAAHGYLVGDPVNVASATGMTQLNGAWTVDTVPSTTTLTLQSNGTPLNTTGFGAYAGGGTAQLMGVKNNLFDTGAFNTIKWVAAAGAYRYNVYKYSNGLWGFLGQSVGTTFVDNSIVPNISKTPPEASNPFPGANDYPGAVGYYEQRRVFAGTINNPQSVWMTKSGTESNMTYSIPYRDSDSVVFKVAARESNTIRHIVPMANMVLLTNSAEWRAASINTDAITPTSLSIKPQSFIGANAAQPVVANNNLVYAAARGGHVREMAWQAFSNWYSQGYTTGDLSLRAPHLFDTFDIVQMAYAKAPYPIVWLVSSNGTLIGLTYVPEQAVDAWHHHDTVNGVFESCCTVAEGAEDFLYVIVRRTIQGAQVRYVERMQSRQYATQADAFFVDCGATYNGAPATTISGLGWLEGQTVSILADGAVAAQRVVTGGAVTLDNAASKVQVGLPITADLQTLPMVIQAMAAGFGRPKSIARAWLRVANSSGLFAGPAFTRLTEFKQRTTEPYGSPPQPVSDEIPIDVMPSWGYGGQLCVRQADPLPMTVTGITIEAAVGG